MYVITINKEENIQQVFYVSQYAFDKDYLSMKGRIKGVDVEDFRLWFIKLKHVESFSIYRMPDIKSKKWFKDVNIGAECWGKNK